MVVVHSYVTLSRQIVRTRSLIARKLRGNLRLAFLIGLLLNPLVDQKSLAVEEAGRHSAKFVKPSLLQVISVFPVTMVFS